MKTFRRIIAMILALIISVSAAAAAFAEEPENTGAAEETDTAVTEEITESAETENPDVTVKYLWAADEKYYGVLRLIMNEKYENISENPVVKVVCREIKYVDNGDGTVTADKESGEEKEYTFDRDSIGVVKKTASVNLELMVNIKTEMGHVVKITICENSVLDEQGSGNEEIVTDKYEGHQVKVNVDSTESSFGKVYYEDAKMRAWVMDDPDAGYGTVYIDDQYAGSGTSSHTVKGLKPGNHTAKYILNGVLIASQGFDIESLDSILIQSFKGALLSPVGAALSGIFALIPGIGWVMGAYIGAGSITSIPNFFSTLIRVLVYKLNPSNW